MKAGKKVAWGFILAIAVAVGGPLASLHRVEFLALGKLRQIRQKPGYGM